MKRKKMRSIVRGANYLNPPAARFVLPVVYKRTEMHLAGHSKVEGVAAIKAALDKKELPAMEPGTVRYMMSKSSYLTDNGDHNGPHLMFYEPVKDDATWGANMPILRLCLLITGTCPRRRMHSSRAFLPYACSR